MLDPKKTSDVMIGMVVKIEESKNFGMGILTEGKITEILTKKSDFPPNGILVLLESGAKGRVKEIIKQEIKEKTIVTSLLPPEGAKFEYKETLLYSDLLEKDPKKAWKVPHSSFKTIAAFANAEGGELWIGVHDSRQPIGLDRDYELLTNVFSKNRDGFELKIKSLLKHYFKSKQKLVLDLISIGFPIIDEIEICKITVKPSLEFPILVWDDDIKSTIHVGPFFYVRQGNSSENYEIEEFLEYWQRHYNAIHGFQKY